MIFSVLFILFFINYFIGSDLFLLQYMMRPIFILFIPVYLIYYYYDHPLPFYQFLPKYILTRVHKSQHHPTGPNCKQFNLNMIKKECVDYRYVDICEKWYLNQPEQRLVIVGTKLKLPVNVEINTMITGLQYSLSRLVEKHPNLCTRIENSTTSQMKLVPLLDYISNKTTNDVLSVYPFIKSAVTHIEDATDETKQLEVMQEQVNIPFDINDKSNCLWRIVVITDTPANPIINDQLILSEEWELVGSPSMINSDHFASTPTNVKGKSTINKLSLVLVLHHAIADGMSSVLFFQHLLPLLHQSLYSTLPSITTPIPLCTLPRLTDCINVAPTLKDTIAAIFKWSWDGEVQQNSKLTKQAYLGPINHINSGDTTKLKLIKISSELLGQIKEKCQCEKTSVHGFLSSIAQISLYETLHTNTPTVFSCSSSVSLRPYCNLPYPLIEVNINALIGVFISAVNSVNTITPNTNMWQLSRDYMKIIRLKIYECHRIWGIAQMFLSDIKDYLSKAESQLIHKRSLSLEIGNLGVLNMNKYFKLNENDTTPSTALNLDIVCDNIIFSQGNHYRGALICHSIVTNETKGELINCLSYPSPYVTELFIEDYIQNWNKLLKQALE